MPKIVQYVLPPGGTVVQLADNNTKALEIESVDNANDYIFVSTEDGEETVTISAGGVGNSLVVDKKRLGTTTNYPTGLFEVSQQRAGIFSYVAGPNDHIKEYINGTNSTWQVLDADGVKFQVDKTGATTGGPVVIEGTLSVALQGTFTATNSSAEITDGSSTAFLTEIFEGSAIEIFEGDGTSRGVYRVADVASNTALTLDSNVTGLSSSPLTGMTGKTDPTLLDVKSGDDMTLLAVTNRYVRINGRGGPSAYEPANDSEVALYIDGDDNSTDNANSTTVVIHSAATNGPSLQFANSGNINANFFTQSSKLYFDTETSAIDMLWRPGKTTFLTMDAGAATTVFENCKVGIGDTTPASMLGVKGDLSTPLTGTFTATNGSAEITLGSSTAFLTQLAIGSAIKIGSEIFTVTAIASDVALTLDSNFAGSTASGLSGTTDPDLFQGISGDSKTRFHYDNLGQLTVCNTAQTNVMVTDGDIVTMTGDNNTIVGSQPLTAMTTSNNTRVGQRAGQGNTGSSSTIVGAQSGEGASTGAEVTLFGFYAGNLGPGGYTTAIGPRALAACVDGGGGGVSNTALGHRAGLTLTSGNQCVFIGDTADTSANDVSNQIAIGYGATTSAANTAVIGDSNIVSLATGGDGVCSLGTAAKGFKELHLKNAFSSGSSSTFDSKGIDVRKADDTISFEVMGAGGVRATFDDTNGLTQDTATLVMVCHTGDCNEHQLTQDITAMTIHFYPAQGTYQTRTCIIQQRDTSGGGAYTITYPSTAAANTGYGTGSLGNVTIKWAGGVKHTMSTGDQAFDIVQFVLTHDTSGNEMIYASVIGQAYA